MFSFLKSKKISFSKTTLAIAAIIFIAYGYSVLSIVSRILSEGFSSMTQVYVRVAAGFLLSLIFFRKNIKLKTIKKISKHDWFWLLMMGIVGYAVAVWLSTLANLNTKLVNASAITSSIPFVVYLYSYFLLKAKIKLKLIMLLALASYGIVIVASKSFLPQFANFGMGEFFSILMVFSAAWWSVGRKKLSNHLNNKEITIITMAIAAFSGLIIATLRGETLILSSFAIPQVLLGIFLGATLNFVLTFLENFAYDNLDVVIASQILRITTVFALINGIIFYGEIPSLPELVGGVIILGSVLAGSRMLKS